MKKVIEIESFNPYEMHFPNRKLIDIGTLKLIKVLRQNGYEVVVNPKTDVPVEYLFRKGIHELFSDSVFVGLFSIASSVIGGLITNFIQKKLDQKNEIVSPNALANIYITDYSQNITVNLHNKPLLNSEKIDIKAKRKIIIKNFEECLNQKSPYKDLPTPIFYEHRPKIIGWNKIEVDDTGIKIVDSHIVDKNVFRKIEQGKITGGSMTGIAEKTVCSICKKDYVMCEHISGDIYNGITCYNSIIQAIPIEFSLVKRPINEQAIIEIVKNQRK